jgi:hypothetical protein
MSLVVYSSFVRLYYIMKYSSLYSCSIMLYLYSLITCFGINLICVNRIGSLSEIRIGIGLMSEHSVALCHMHGCRVVFSKVALCRMHGCRVVFSNVSTVLRLLDTINWGYMPRVSRVEVGR